jgi:hypothetical protein
MPRRRTNDLTRIGVGEMLFAQSAVFVGWLFVHLVGAGLLVSFLRSTSNRAARGLLRSDAEHTERSRYDSRRPDDGGTHQSGRVPGSRADWFVVLWHGAATIDPFVAKDLYLTECSLFSAVSGRCHF